MRREALKAAYEQLADAEDLRKAGQPELAFRITSSLVKQFPTYWAALHTHGLVLSEKGDLAEALKFLLLADSVWPDQPMTIAALAQTQLNCGLVEQALDRTERGLAIAPDHSELLYTRAEIFRGIARYAKAEPLYRRILEVQGPHLKASVGLANCLLELGRARDAAQLLESAVTRWPAAFEPVYELAAFPKAFLTCEPAALLERWTAGPADVVDPASLAFARSWALHHDGRFAEAWQHLKRANQLVFDVERDAAHRDLDGKRHELRRLEGLDSGIDWRAPSHRDDCPHVLFILGPSRSGKTTLESLLESCGLIRGDESNLIATTVRDTLQGAGFVPFEAAEALPKHVRETFVARYCAKVRELAGPGDCLTITNPEIIADVPYLVGLIPNLRFMLVDRDANDLIFSIYQQHYARGNLYAYSLQTTDAYVGWYRSMAALLRARAPHLAAACTYEDLIERPRDVLASVGRLLGRNLEVRADFQAAFDGRNCSGALSRTHLSGVGSHGGEEMSELHLERARGLFEQGIEKFQSKDYKSAQERFEAALELAPDRATVLNNLAACLIRNGDAKRALEVSHRSVGIDPGNPDGWVNVAASLCAEKKFREAKEAAQKALAINPRDSDAWYHVGYCCFAFGEATEALRAYDKALEANPSLTEAMFGTGTIFATLKYRHAALLCFERCLALEPNHAQAHFARATLLQELDHREDAIAAYQEALRHKHPDERDIRYSLASLGVGQTPDRPPASYVTRLFDAYAANFEDHLRKSLNYQVPEIISKILSERGIKNAKCLDLGCGTGLVGKLVRDRCRLLVGVDLSEKMLEIARSKTCYDELHKADLVEHLSTTAGPYDVVCAADVLNYFGDLRPVFAAVLGVLARGGLFIFTVEEPVGPQEGDFALQSTMRYTHSKGYCERTADKSGFSRIDATPVVLRMESGRPVAATCFALHRA